MTTAPKNEEKKAVQSDSGQLPGKFKQALKKDPVKALLPVVISIGATYVIARLLKMNDMYGEGADIGFAIVGGTFGMLTSALMFSAETAATQPKEANNNENSNKS